MTQTAILELPLFTAAPAFKVARNASWIEDIVLVQRGSPTSAVAITGALLQGSIVVGNAAGISSCVQGMPIEGPGLSIGARIAKISSAAAFVLSLPALIDDPIANLVALPLGYDLTGIEFELQGKKSTADRTPRFSLTTQNGYLQKLDGGRLGIRVPTRYIKAIPADVYVADLLAIVDRDLDTEIRVNLCRNSGSATVYIQESVTEQ